MLLLSDGLREFRWLMSHRRTPLARRCSLIALRAGRPKKARAGTLRQPTPPTPGSALGGGHAVLSVTFIWQEQGRSTKNQSASAISRAKSTPSMIGTMKSVVFIADAAMRSCATQQQKA